MRFVQSPRRVALVVSIALGLGALAPATALANGFGFAYVQNSSLTLEGTRSAIASPSSFNILPGNFGLMRVVAEKDTTSSGSGLIQVGFGQFNDIQFDQGCTFGDPGQLKQYWEIKPLSTSGTNYTCGIIGNIGAEEDTYRVQRSGTGVQMWGAYIGSNRYTNSDINFDEATYVAAGGEIADATNFNGSTAISGHYAYNGGQVWQRVDDVAGSGTWTTISSATGAENSPHQWVVPGPPGDFQIHFCGSSC